MQETHKEILELDKLKIAGLINGFFDHANFPTMEDIPAKFKEPNVKLERLFLEWWHNGLQSLCLTMKEEKIKETDFVYFIARILHEKYLNFFHKKALFYMFMELFVDLEFLKWKSN
jgi:hypothetical protein